MKTLHLKNPDPLGVLKKLAWNCIIFTATAPWVEIIFPVGSRYFIFIFLLLATILIFRKISDFFSFVLLSFMAK